MPNTVSDRFLEVVVVGRLCARCGVNIDGRDRRSRHCGPRCRDRDYEGAAVGTVRSCLHCGTEFSPSKGTQVYCGKACCDRADLLRNREAYNSRNAARRARLRDAPLGPPFTRDEVFARDRWICQLCMTPTGLQTGRHPMAPTIDHIVPLNKGGAHTIDNVWTAHMACNGAKGDRAITVLPVPINRR
jgi:5-methylcytosine-specific restriction endonuclease McrA